MILQVLPVQSTLWLYDFICSSDDTQKQISNIQAEHKWTRLFTILINYQPWQDIVFLLTKSHFYETWDAFTDKNPSTAILLSPDLTSHAESEPFKTKCFDSNGISLLLSLSGLLARYESLSWVKECPYGRSQTMYSTSTYIIPDELLMEDHLKQLLNAHPTSRLQTGY